MLWLGAAARRIEVRLERNYPAAQVYAPTGTPVVSLEPMTAPVDALVSGRGLRLARPGTAFCATFVVEAG